MDFIHKQNRLLLASSVSLAVMILLNILLKQTLWLAVLDFLPFIFYAILTCTTNQKLFRLKQQWNIFLTVMFIMNIKILNRAITFLLQSVNFNSTSFRYTIIITILLTYIFFYWRNYKQQIQSKSSLS
jgi:hypothetical protein